MGEDVHGENEELEGRGAWIRWPTEGQVDVVFTAVQNWPWDPTQRSSLNPAQLASRPAHRLYHPIPS